MPNIPIGRMDRVITIEQLTQGVGVEYGEPTQTWSTWKEVWANVNLLQGRELWQARQVTAEADTRFQIRWVDGLKPTMRISYDSKVYDIYSVNEVGRRRYWSILAKARNE